MKRNDVAQITARLQEVDRILEMAGIPSYTEMWTTNADLQAELDRLEDRFNMANVALSRARGDLLQAEMIVGTAASVAQIKRQLGMMKAVRKTLARSQQARFEQRWGESGEAGN